MLRITTSILLFLLGVFVIVLKLGSFRHVGSDDPTVSLYFGEFLQANNRVLGDLPKPDTAYALLARSENGFVGEDIYAFAMSYSLLVAGLCFVGAYLLYRKGAAKD